MDTMCPIKLFETYTGVRNPLCKETLELLSKKLDFLEYEKDGISNEAYIVDLMMGGTSTLGFRIAVILYEMTAEKGNRLILIRDVINPLQIVCEAHQYEDDRYTVGIMDSENTIFLYIYKK